MTSIFAHRGASHAEPENTVAAFVRARELGADGVELDVRRHESGTLAIAHDPVLGAPLAPSVPDLATALDACAGMRVNIEIKNYPGDPDFDDTESLAERVVELLHGRDGGDDVFVSSFGMPCIDRVRALDPSIETAFLVMHAPDDDVIGRIIHRTVRHGHGGVNPHHAGMTPHLVELAHAAGLTVNTWTVDDPARIRELASWGVDCIITNVPDVARAALRG
ncbi:MAG: glycerophosphoryl diester phosphodiesterase [Actinomycetota bacterium]|nr:glycerophosphoryl diester phosphodiesterase [Actinomycetota bacterium]